MSLRIIATAVLSAVGILVGAFAAPVPTLAQSDGSISGTVSDFAKTALGHAQVTMTGPGYNKTILTNPDGTFTADVPPGIYTVQVNDSGFESAENGNVVVVSGGTSQLSFELANASLATIGRVVAIGGGALSINTTTSALASVSAQTFSDQGQKGVANVLDQIPGVEILRVNGGSNEPGANTSISIRGAQPYESQILLDGHPVETAGNGAYGFDPSYLNSLLLSGVEVSKGPGNLPNTIEDAVGGTVNFKTASITPTFSADAMAGYDSYNSSYYGIRVSDTFGKLGILAGVARYETPGYLGTKTLFGGNNTDSTPSSTFGIPTDPNPYAVFGPGASYQGVINYAYTATSAFESDTQLFKLSYDFSPITSVLLTSYATQTTLDETGNNVGNIYATIVPCISAPGNGTQSTTCVPGSLSDNYTNQQYGNLIGTIQPINYYAAYPNAELFDNEPIFSGEFRTLLGPGSFLARYYAGSITRSVYQSPDPQAIGPCYTPACAWDPINTANNGSSYDNGYPGEPYVHPIVDVLHGFDAQYTVPFGNNYVTLGYDRHVDQALFTVMYSVNDPTNLASFYELENGAPRFYTFQSQSASVRGGVQLAPKLQFSGGIYASASTYVGSRIDPRGGIVYTIDPSTTVRLSAGSAFVAPFYNLVILKPSTSGTTITLPSTSFAPETSMGYDFGSDVKISPDTLFSGDLYLNNVFNRYAEVTAPGPYAYNGKTYATIVQDGNQANAREEGIELRVSHQPKTGFGASIALELLRDYAYNQAAVKSTFTVFSAGLPANGVQFPLYPFSKIRTDLFYTFGNKAQVRLGATTYGANNGYGQPGFTTLDGLLSIPTPSGPTLQFGVTNLTDVNGSQSGGIFNGGYTYPLLTGGTGYDSLTYAQPFTVFLQATEKFGGK